MDAGRAQCLHNSLCCSCWDNMLLPGPAQSNLDTSHRSAEDRDFAVLWFRWKCVILWPEDDERDVFVPTSQLSSQYLHYLQYLPYLQYLQYLCRVFSPSTHPRPGHAGRPRSAVAAARGNPLSERKERMSVVTIKLSNSQVSTDTA